MRPALLNKRSTGADDGSVVLYLMKLFVIAFFCGFLLLHYCHWSCHLIVLKVIRHIHSHHQKQTVPVAHLAVVEMLWQFLRLHQRSIELLKRVFQAGPIWAWTEDVTQQLEQLPLPLHQTSPCPVDPWSDCSSQPVMQIPINGRQNCKLSSSIQFSFSRSWINLGSSKPKKQFQSPYSWS
jgi:hypothetical protein